MRASSWSTAICPFKLRPLPFFQQDSSLICHKDGIRKRSLPCWRVEDGCGRAIIAYVDKSVSVNVDSSACVSTHLISSEVTSRLRGVLLIVARHQSSCQSVYAMVKSK